MAAKGLADETALKNAYGYLIEQASKGTEYAKLTARELKLLLNQAGEVSEKNLQNMLEWAKTMPEHFDRLGGDSLKYLKERWAKYTKNGTAEKIETALEGTIEKRPIVEELGEEEIKVIVEQAEAMSGNVKIRVGRWMSEDEYAKMLSTGKVQMSTVGNTTYVASPSDIRAFEKQASPGSIYVEFDVDAASVYPAGKIEWGQIPGPGSIYDRLNQKKGLPPIEDMPEATNIIVKGKK